MAKKKGERVGHFMYGAWCGMINRCHNPNNSSYARYGGVGITVCQRWREDFLNFLSDMGERPAGMTLDRINPLLGYSPDNCRWADAKTQRHNISEAGKARAIKVISEKAKARWSNFMSNRKTCKFGHPWVEENLYHHPKGFDQCVTCRKEQAARQWKRKAATALEIGK